MFWLSYTSAEPVALVTVWAMPSPFIQVTVVPWATVRFNGPNVEPFMHTWVAVDVQPPPPPPTPSRLLLLHAAAPRTATNASIRIRMTHPPKVQADKLRTSYPD